MAEISESPVPPRRWLQFSLRTTLLSLVLIAVVLSIGVSVRQFGQIRALRAENKRLRNEVGEIKIEDGDEQKVHAIAVPILEPMTWKWRVHVPSDRPFRIEAVVNEIPNKGEEKGGPRLSMTAGESVVTMALRRDEKGNWAWIFKTEGIGSSSSVSPEIVKLLDSGSKQCTSTHVTALKVVTPGNDLELLRLRFVPGQGAVSSREIPKAGPGVWVRIREGKIN